MLPKAFDKALGEQLRLHVVEQDIGDGEQLALDFEGLLGQEQAQVLRERRQRGFHGLELRCCLEIWWII